MKLGFIGIGKMGTGIVRNLLKNGHHVIVWDRYEEPVAELAALGAEVAQDLVEVAKYDVVFSMLAHDEAIETELINSRWLETVANSALIHVNLSTISVAYAKQLQLQHESNGVTYVGCPVFGRPDAALNGTLNLVVAGPAETLDFLQPALSAISAQTWVVGEQAYQANLVKIGGNMMIASAIESMAEATALGTANGIDRNIMLDVYLSALFPCGVYQGYGNFIRQRDYQPVGFKLPLGLKDVRLALEAGEQSRVPLPLASVVHQSLVQAMACGYEDKDWSSLAEMSYVRAGLIEK